MQIMEVQNIAILYQSQKQYNKLKSKNHLSFQGKVRSKFIKSR